ncbi:unnamed protein product [Pleuronectes platessa]|uniref:Uncharacterized protein n=1 Tax=Pleuronectes platessa TaxID=8262 RepID=A0A9N7URH3_PLEPL|nr:unnamed protein product [Pleuronectes platessa]
MLPSDVLDSSIPPVTAAPSPPTNLHHRPPHPPPIHTTSNHPSYPTVQPLDSSIPPVAAAPSPPTNLHHRPPHPPPIHTTSNHPSYPTVQPLDSSIPSVAAAPSPPTNLHHRGMSTGKKCWFVLPKRHEGQAPESRRSGGDGQVGRAPLHHPGDQGSIPRQSVTVRTIGQRKGQVVMVRLVEHLSTIPGIRVQSPGRA